MPSYTFGPFRLDSEAAILFRRGEPVALGSRAVGLLRVLVERRGLPVSKHEMRRLAGAAVIGTRAYQRRVVTIGVA